jgi:hypothetical protein
MKFLHRTIRHRDGRPRRPRAYRFAGDWELASCQNELSVIADHHEALRESATA